MGDKRSNSSLGDQILNAVDSILESGNFEKLNSVVSDTVSKALEETRRQLEQITNGQAVSGKAAKEVPKKTQGTIVQGIFSGHKTVSGGFSEQKTSMVRNESALTYRDFGMTKNKLKRVGSVSSILFRVFGSIGTGIFGFIFLLVCVSNIGDGRYWSGMAVTGVLLAVSLLMIGRGADQSARLKRAERYVQLMQGKAYINLSDLALLVNKSTAHVRRDIKRMIQKGIFPEGHLDQQEQCLILGDVAYREYMRLEKSRKALQAEEQKRLQAEEVKAADKTANTEAKQGKENGKAEDASHAENAKLQAMIQEGNDCVRQLRDLNDAIEGEVISAKLFYLENILKEIFEQLEEHPEQMPEMHKFMEYYLPTTLKLMTAYEEFDHVSVPGEDILSAKREIEKTLDTINTAFAELLNKLFRDRAFDIATDAQVLKTMLEREGLTKEAIFAEKRTK